MDAWVIALIVAGITGGAGIVQGFVQGRFASRAATISARQEAARDGIALCDRVGEQLAGMAQAANEYGLELADATFMNDWERREPKLRAVLGAHGQTLAAVESLPPGSPIHGPAREAIELCAGLPEHGDRQKIIKRWHDGNPVIPKALAAIGRERARYSAMLGAAARPWWTRKRAAEVQRWWLPFATRRGIENGRM